MQPRWMSTASGPKIAFTRGSHGASSCKKLKGSFLRSEDFALEVPTNDDDDADDDDDDDFVFLLLAVVFVFDLDVVVACLLPDLPLGAFTEEEEEEESFPFFPSPLVDLPL